MASLSCQAGCSSSRAPAPFERLGERGRADGQRQEVLDVEPEAARVGSPGDDIDHRHRQQRLGSPELVLVERDAVRRCGGDCGGDRDGDDRVPAQAAELRSPVELAQACVEPRLIGRVQSVDRGGHLVLEPCDRLEHAPPAIRRSPVAHLDSLVPPGRCAGWSDRLPRGTAVEADLAGNRGVASRVESLPGSQAGDPRRRHPAFQSAS